MRRRRKANPRRVDTEGKKKNFHNFVTASIKTRDIFMLPGSKYFSLPELDVHTYFIDYDGNHD
jgi:hypothetical protein